MQPFFEVETKDLSNYKNNMLYGVYTTFLIMVLMLHFFFFRSQTEEEQVYKNIENILLILLIGMIGLSVLLKKRYIKNQMIIKIIYTVFTSVYFWMFFLLAVNISPVFLAGSISTLIFVMFFLLDLRFLTIFNVSVLIGMIYFGIFLRQPFDISLELYLRIYLPVLFMIILSYPGVLLFKNYEQRLKETTYQLKMMITNMKILLEVTEDAIINFNITKGTCEFNQNASQAFHLEEVENTNNQRMNYLLKQIPDDIFRKSLKKAFIEENVAKDLEFSLGEKEAEQYYRAHMVYYRRDHDRIIVVAIKNITYQKQHETYLYKIAYTDQLTGINNRMGFCKKLDEMLPEEFNEEWSMYLMDIKDLKSINTTIGFFGGDWMLQEIRKHIERLFPDLSLMGRVGGDEFALVFDKMKLPDEVVPKIEKEFDMFYSDNFIFSLSFNTGIIYINKKEAAGDLIQKAEIAMYEAKRSLTKDVFVYESQFERDMERSLFISRELNSAIYNKEIYMLFQPKIRAIDKKIIGFEALVRWESSKLGFVTPPEFINIAEKSGMIRKLGNYIIEAVCHFVRLWMREYPDLIVSINVSAIQLLEEGFVETFFEIIDKFEIPHHNIGIEITETALLNDLDSAKLVLEEIRAKEILVYMDDFGTGYSSLSYLSQLPVDILKIDKSFINGVENNYQKKKMVHAIIQLAKEFKLKTVAEGVENMEQYEYLKEEDCEYIQGYYFSKPLEEQEALKKIIKT